MAIRQTRKRGTAFVSAVKDAVRWEQLRERLDGCRFSRPFGPTCEKISPSVFEGVEKETLGKVADSLHTVLAHFFVVVMPLRAIDEVFFVLVEFDARATLLPRPLHVVCP